MQFERLPGFSVRLRRIARFAWVLIPAASMAQPGCVNGMRIEGIVTDPSGAVIRGAQVMTAS